jgi:hypothetical protein
MTRVIDAPCDERAARSAAFWIAGPHWDKSSIIHIRYHISGFRRSFGVLCPFQSFPCRIIASGAQSSTSNDIRRLNLDPRRDHSIGRGRTNDP